MNRADLQRLARIRQAEADALLLSDHFSGAYYLAGYAIECALKACVAKNTARYDFPDKDLAGRSYTHNLRSLLALTGLDQRMIAESALQPELSTNWNTVQNWTETSRYRIVSQAEAEEMIAAMGSKLGVMRWIVRYW